MRFGIREMVLVLVLLAVPLASYFVVFKPRNEQIRVARAQIVSKQTKLHELELATRHIDDLGKEIDKLTSAISVFQAKLPAEKEVEVILKEVWQLAARRGLNTRSVRTDKPIKTDRYSELPIKMVIAGDADGFYDFLLDVERLSRITRIHELRTQRTNDRDGSIEAVFTLSIFFDAQLAAAPATGS